MLARQLFTLDISMRLKVDALHQEVVIAAVPPVAGDQVPQGQGDACFEMVRSVNRSSARTAAL